MGLISKDITIACIGSGNMGFALMKGAVKALGPGKIGFSDLDTQKVKEAAAALGSGTNEVCSVYSTNVEAAQKSDYIFLAVKPQILAVVLDEIAPEINKRLSDGENPVLVSMAAGWSIERIQASIELKNLGTPINPKKIKVPVIRIMPNTPALISKGMIALASSPEVQPEKISQIEELLKSAGLVDRIEERFLDAVTGLSGSGPAFVYTFIEALADGGVRAGLPRDKALRYAAQTVLGAAAMVQESGRHPGELKDMVTSPGGTTIAGLAVLESGAFRGTVIQAVEAAWRRAGEL